MVAIDFNSHIPYYYQLIEIIKSQVNQGLWLPGEKMPSELELCESYGVSRTVVRQALRELEMDNVIYRRKGKGTYVAKPKINEGLIQKLTGFYQDMVERGLDPETEVLYQQIKSAEPKVAKYLEIPVGTDVIDIKRLRSIHGEPIQLVTTYIPHMIAPNLINIDLSDRSLYEYLETEYEIKIARGVRYIEAVLANHEEAMLLEIDEGDPLVMLDSVSYNETGQAIEYYHALHRGDRSRFEVELIRLENNHE
jgi:GntR family transcriptional regulator